MTGATASALNGWRAQWKAILLGVALTLATYGLAWCLAIIVDQRSSYVVPDEGDGQAILAAAMRYEMAGITQESTSYRQVFPDGDSPAAENDVPSTSRAVRPCDHLGCDDWMRREFASCVDRKDDIWLSPANYIAAQELPPPEDPHPYALAPKQHEPEYMRPTDAPPIILLRELVERDHPRSPAVRLPLAELRQLRQIVDESPDRGDGLFVTFTSPLRRGDWAMVGRSKVCRHGGLCSQGDLFALHRDRDGWRVVAVSQLWVS
mgnify:CR=1 FL=1